MKSKPPLAFYNTTLDRSGHLRNEFDPENYTDENKHAQHIIIWNGKPLIDWDQKSPKLACLKESHQLVKASKLRVFLGKVQEVPIFANELTDWNDPTIKSNSFNNFLDTTQNHHPDAKPKHFFCELRTLIGDLSENDLHLSGTAKSLIDWHKQNLFCSSCGHGCLPTKSGWESKCTECNRVHFPRTDPVVIMLIIRGNHTLLGRAHNWPKGMYSCLAGFIEPGETISQAVKRETFEEVGIKVQKVKFCTSQPWPFPSSLMIGCSAETSQISLNIDQFELEKAVWISREQAMESLLGLNDAFVPARPGTIARFLIESWVNNTI